MGREDIYRGAQVKVVGLIRGAQVKVVGLIRGAQGGRQVNGKTRGGP